MVIVLFEYAMRDGVDLDAYSALATRLQARAAADPAFGYLGQQGYERDDGSMLFVERFTDLDSVRRWAEDPEHRAAQRRGREEFYTWHRVRVLSLEREYVRGAPPPG
jgi:heme-degrading monooxygenase HmoA